MNKKLNRLQDSIKDATSYFYEDETQITEEKEATQTTEKTHSEETKAIMQQSSEIARKAGRPSERGETYRFSLYLDGDLKAFIDYRVWQQRQKSITTYLNKLIRQDMENYISEGGNPDEWTNDN